MFYNFQSIALKIALMIGPMAKTTIENPGHRYGISILTAYYIGFYFYFWEAGDFKRHLARDEQNDYKLIWESFQTHCSDISSCPIVKYGAWADADAALIKCKSSGLTLRDSVKETRLDLLCGNFIYASRIIDAATFAKGKREKAQLRFEIKVLESDVPINEDRTSELEKVISTN
jgi:hypothetical protein